MHKRRHDLTPKVTEYKNTLIQIILKIKKNLRKSQVTI